MKKGYGNPVVDCVLPGLMVHDANKTILATCRVFAHSQSAKQLNSKRETELEGNKQQLTATTQQLHVS